MCIIFLEAKKLTYEDMAKYYGDPAFGEIPIATLLSDDYASEREERDRPLAGGRVFTGDGFRRSHHLFDSRRC